MYVGAGLCPPQNILDGFAVSLDSHVLLMMGAAAICLALSLYVWKRSRDAIASSLPPLLTAAAVWSFFYGLELALPGIALMRVALTLQYVGIATIAVLWFIFAARYSGRGEGLTGSRVGLLFIVPAITVALVATNSLHHLYYTSVQPGMVEGKSFLIVETGPFYWVHVLYSYVLLVAGALLMLRAALGSSGIHRVRAGLFLGGVLLPFVVNVCYVLGLRPYGFLDLTPVAFVITGIAFTLGALTFDLFAITPIALDTLFDRIPDAVLMLDVNGRVVNANPRARELLREGLVLRPVDDGMEAGKRDRVQFTPWGKEGDVHVGERTYHSLSTALVDRAGGRLGTLVVMRDITDRKQAERALERSRDAYQSLVDNLPGAAYRCSLDEHWTMHYLSTGIEGLTGYPAADFLKNRVRSFAIVLHPDDISYVESCVKAAVAEDRPFEIEYRVIRRDGRVCWVLDKGQIVNEEGGEAFLSGVLLDITQQKRDRLEIERSQRELRKLATHLQVVREEERAAVAWELHDEIGQALAVVKMDLARHDSRLSGAESAAVQPGLQDTVALLDETIGRLRRLYTDLRPGMLDDLGLSATIEWQTTEFGRLSGIDCRLTRLDEIELADDRANLAVYRAYQEVLSSGVRQAGATRVEVSVERYDDRMVVRVTDDGARGVEEDQDSVLALRYAAMRHSLRGCHGSVVVSRNGSEETVTEIIVPLRPQQMRMPA